MSMGCLQVIVPGEPPVYYWHTANGVIEIEPTSIEELADGWYLSRSWIGEHTDYAANTIGLHMKPPLCD